MKLSRERKILLGVLLLGGGALLIDRVVLGAGQTGPDAAEAGTLLVAPDEPQTDAPDPAKPASSTVSSGPSIAEMLNRTQQTHPHLAAGTRDGFQPPSHWFGAPALATTDSPSLAARNAAAEFVAGHRLSAVMNHRVAIINGQPHRVGDTVDGFVLMSVDRNAATLRRGEITVTLTMGDASP